MKSKLLILLIALCAASPAAIAREAWQVPATSELREAVGPPPAPGSPQDQNDLLTLLAIQSRANDAQRERAALTSRMVVPEVFQAALGPEFTADRYPLTLALIQRVFAKGRPEVDALKAHWARERPAVAHGKDGVIPLMSYENFSYPSGHSFRGWMAALVLAELAPEKRLDIFYWGAEVGNDRVLAGVHYPSDVVAGRAMARHVFNRLMSQTSFLSELETARAAEWRSPRPAR